MAGEQPHADGGDSEVFRTFFERCGSGLLQTDRSSHIVRVNPSFCELVGYTADELRGRSEVELTHPDDREAESERRAPVARGEADTWELEKRYLRKDGEVVWALVAGRLMRDQDGRPAYTIAAVLDLSAHRRSEEGVRREQELLQLLFDSIPVMIAMYDPRTREVRLNREFERATGWSAGEAQGVDLLAAFYPDPAALENVRSFIRSARPGWIDVRMTTRSGRPLEASWSNTRLSDGTYVGIGVDITERRRTEQALRESHGRYRALVEASTQVVWTWSPSGKIVDSAADAARWWESLTGQQVTRWDAWLESVVAEDRERVAGVWRAAIESRQPYEIEYRVRTREGGLAWVRATAVPVIEPDGHVHEWVGTLSDVTTEQQARAALERSERLYRGIGESIDYGIWVCEPDGRNVYASDSFLALVGMSQAQCSGFGWANALGPAEREATIDAFRECVRSGAPWERELRFRGVDGRWHHILSRGVPIRDHGRAVVCWAGLHLDIGGLKRTEQELATARDELATELAAMQSLHALTTWQSRDTDLRPFLQAVLDATLRVLGARAGALKLSDADACRLSIVAHRGLDAPCLEELRRLDREGGTCRLALGRRERVVLEDTDQSPPLAGDTGSLRAAGVRALQTTPLISRSGELFGTLVTYFDRPHRPRENDLRLVDLHARQAADLIERTRAEQALREADRRKDEFLAMLAHELRNPLAPLRNALELLRRAGDDRDLAERARAVMVRQISQLVRLIDDLLDVARITRGSLTLHREPLDLARAIESAIETSRPVIDAAGHALRVALPREPLVVDADPTRLAQIFANLLNNAAHYMEPGGSIELWATREGDEAVVRVRDTGMGISREALPRVFDGLGRDSRTSQSGGLGIGLSLVQRLVALHGGRVEAWSAGLGRGSEFTVHLPLVAAAPGPAPSEPEPRAEGTARRRILVVDDNADAASSLEMLVRLSGHEARSAFTGRQALELAESFDPDVVLLDLGLPDLSGYEVARRLRTLSRDPPLTLVAVTGWGQEEDRRRTRRAGFDHHLIKPVEPEVLQSLLADAGPAT